MRITALVRGLINLRDTGAFADVLLLHPGKIPLTVKIGSRRCRDGHFCG
jgi:hypothetical protein